MAPPTDSRDFPERPSVASARGSVPASGLDGASTQTAPGAGLVIQVDGLGVQYSLRLTRRTSVRRSFASLLRSRRGPRRMNCRSGVTSISGTLGKISGVGGAAMGGAGRSRGSRGCRCREL
jgi:hypothetical protein